MISRLAAGLIAAIVMILVVIAALFTVAGSTLAGPSLTSCTGPPGPDPGTVAGLDPAQVAIATTVVQEAADEGLPRRAAVIAVAVALQESGLRNLTTSVDHDSRGVFQQRPSQGWGSAPATPADHRTPAQRLTDPGYAASAFYTALRQVPRWSTMPLADAAQAVQRSARPQAYARWEPLATTVVATVTGRACLALPSSAGPAARTAIDYARAQLGLPYEWGGDGPAEGDAGFDCSGLTRAAYAAAGISLPRTAQAQYQSGPRVPSGAPLQPGDLVFFGTPANVHHVGLFLGNNLMVNAPHRGAPVRIEDYHWSDYLGATRPGRSPTGAAAGP